LLRGDADGVVVIPQALQEQVLTYAEEITLRENAVRAAIRSGMRMDEARRQHHYHALQSPDYSKVAG
jgi:regulator of RNase E activity RraA